MQVKCSRLGSSDTQGASLPSLSSVTMTLEILPLQLCKPLEGTLFSRKVQGQKQTETLLDPYLRPLMCQARGPGPSIPLLPPRSNTPRLLHTMTKAMVDRHSLLEVLGRFTTQRLPHPPTCNLVFHITTSLQADQVGVPLQLDTSWPPVEAGLTVKST